MRAVLLDSKTGAIGVYDVPEPELQANGILVETRFSVISTGTEAAKIATGEKSLLGKARARPDLVRQVIDYARTNGIRAAYEKVMARLDSLQPLGYSCSGVVRAVGEGVTDFQPGDRVACAGAGYANHSELNFVPRNLAAWVPDTVPLEHAAITTIGAIALHGLRQAEVRFGETVVIIGAGLIGILAIQLARAAGCRVVAVDIDPARVQRARESGAEAAFLARDPELVENVSTLSRYGADVAVITASGRSSEPVELAARLVRDRGRIVIVGDVEVAAERELLYRKELSLVLARSYGPGRYDPVYEDKGVDYPLGYVRWTVQRNMEAFLEALRSGTVNVAPLVEHQLPVEDAPRAYEKIRSGTAYTVLLQFPACEPQKQPSQPLEPVTTIERAPRQPLRIGCIGAGNFARGTIFPYLRRIPGVVMEAVATATGIAAETARRSAGFRRALTPDALVAETSIDAVWILTRHDSHAKYVLEALRHGKPVFVEKPLCVRREELALIRKLYIEELNAGKNPFVMVGFNRRFAPYTEKLKEFFQNRQEPLALHIRVNAGFLPRDHWVQQAPGGRIVGELCHFLDWARFVVGKPVALVSALALPDLNRYNHDNVAVWISFTDGSIANVLYVANGDRTVPKEYIEAFCEGSVARLHDFRFLELIRNGKKRVFKSSQDKGHRQELDRTIQALRHGGSSPIPFDEVCEVTELTFRIQAIIDNRSLCELPGESAQNMIRSEHQANFSNCKLSVD
jgi:predicted dehydrogenase/threonine dehydrogenase-like Zn-dependent dehydrogenase